MLADRPTLAAIATTRFGFGARPGELAAARSDPRGWVLESLRGAYQAPADLRGLAAGREVLAAFLELRAERAAARRQLAREGAAADPLKGQPDTVREHILPQYVAQANARCHIAIESGASFRERLVHFWSNHFAVSIDKPICLGLAGALENEAIRPHIDGRFENLLFAVETHPAMVTYLDNQRSMGPNSPLAAQIAQHARGSTQGRSGLNENLAREILELHTLGVDAGYTQADVTSFAAVITGWSIGGGEGRFGGGEPGAFVFREALHEPGARTVMGRRYTEDGVGQGLTVLRDLAAHPATARHLAMKLARHFVADEPPPALVDRLAKTYLAHQGHLPSVYRALVNSDEAWQSEPLKYKQPCEFIYSALRALAVTPPEPKALLASFAALGQRHWSPGSPAGWPDRQADWDGADALMQRIEWSVALADRLGDSHPALDAADAALGPLATAHTREALARASSGSQAVALLLMSPEFQRR
jgi:uncharacterized protein (DUF1800 family)